MKNNQVIMRRMGEYQFVAGLSMPESWFLQGRRLVLSAEALLRDAWDCRRKAEEIMKVKTEFEAGDPDSDIFDRAYNVTTPAMILGFAFENFLKGIWVLQNSHLSLETMRRLPTFGGSRSHNLEDLAASVALQLTPPESEALRVLSECATWRGRYPICTNATQNGEAFASARNLDLLFRKYPGDVDWPDEIQSLFGKLSQAEKQVREKIRQTSPQTQSD